MESAAGFKIGMPVAWKQAIDILVAHLNQPARDFHLVVSLGSWSYDKPWPQAEYLRDLDPALTTISGCCR